MKLEKYSIGIGDRFSQQGRAQLAALQMARQKGLLITPVWNKSFREHQLVHSFPIETREAADNAVKDMHWEQSYFVDADHIKLSNVDSFVESSDYFTLDVADYIGKRDSDERVAQFIKENSGLIGTLKIEGIEKPFIIDQNLLMKVASKYLFAIKEAATLYRHIKTLKGNNQFITEVSMDEVDNSQASIELYFILKELAQECVSISAIAPKFSGRFNKGVDFVGNLGTFETEFEEYLCVLQAAKREFKLSQGLKLSIHSGSDKFSLYPIMGRLIQKYNQGIHLKTAGTTWLEELIGLALAGDESLEMVKNIYFKALLRFDELCLPYSSVIDISPEKLPEVDKVRKWDGVKFANSLRHISSHPDYNADFRQLMHVSYKIAAEYANVYIHYLNANKELVGKQVTDNLYSRHIAKLFNL
jgi:tagaturonate epimerase